jgi:transcriptional regulator with XRE-family HTH domain
MKKPIESEVFDRIRKRAGLTYKQFGARLGLSEQYVSNIINGNRRLSRSVLEKLRERFNADIHTFFDDSFSLADTAYIELFRQEASAGRGVEIEDYAERTHIAVPAGLGAPYNAEHIKAVWVHGDSMIGEKIYDGDYVLFNKNIVTGNSIFVLSVGSTLLVKRVAFDKLMRSITLISANSAYLPRVIAGAELEGVKIEGKVVAKLHRVQ